MPIRGLCGRRMMTGKFSGAEEQSLSDSSRQIIENLRILCDLTRHCLDLVEQNEPACLAELLANRRACMDRIDHLYSCSNERIADKMEKRDWLFMLSSLDAALKLKADEKMQTVRQELKNLYDQPDAQTQAAGSRIQGQLLDLLR